MKKQITLFLFSAAFLYGAFAVDHYLDNKWFETPTRIILFTLMAIHLLLLLLSLATKSKEEWQNTSNKNHTDR